MPAKDGRKDCTGGWDHLRNPLSSCLIHCRTPRLDNLKPWSLGVSIPVDPMGVYQCRSAPPDISLPGTTPRSGKFQLLRIHNFGGLDYFIRLDTLLYDELSTLSNCVLKQICVMSSLVLDVHLTRESGEAIRSRVGHNSDGQIRRTTRDRATMLQHEGS